MRLKASFSALAGLAFLTMLHIDWDGRRDGVIESVVGRPVSQTVTPSRDHGVVEITRCSSSTRLVEATKHYDFYGTLEHDADQSFRQRLLVSQDFSGRTKKFAGQADWHIDWYPCIEPRGTGCRLSGVAAVAYVTYTLPRWADRSFAGEPLRARWDRYADNLLAHERGHGTVALEIARQFERELVGLVDMERCEDVTEEANRRVERIIRRGEAMQNEYDRLTEHGSAQGAVFPF